MRCAHTHTHTRTHTAAQLRSTDFFICHLVFFCQKTNTLSMPTAALNLTGLSSLLSWAMGRIIACGSGSHPVPIKR